MVKVNVDTDNQYAFTRALAGHVLDHWEGVLRVDGGIGDKHSFDPRAWGRAGEAAMAERVRQACEQLGSAGRSLAASVARYRVIVGPACRGARRTYLEGIDHGGGGGRAAPAFAPKAIKMETFPLRTGLNERQSTPLSG